MHCKLYSALKLRQITSFNCFHKEDCEISSILSNLLVCVIKNNTFTFAP